MSTIIRCPAPALAEVRRRIESGQKINAIKHLRTHGKQFPPEWREGPDGRFESHSVGLRNAKDAVEAMMGQNPNPRCRAVPMLRIKSFTIETGEGDVEVDLDGLQLKLLEGLDHFPLDAVSEMVELVAFIRKWQGEVEHPNP